MNFELYAIDESYMSFLRQNEKRIPHQDYWKIESLPNGITLKHKLFKPFIGIVFTSPSGQKYCTQISSAKEKHNHLQENIDFKKIYFVDKKTNKKYLVAVVNLNYMFPVADAVLTKVTASNLHILRDFSSAQEASKYWNFLMKELEVINSNNWEKDIETIYKRTNLSIAKRSFDFTKLEKLCENWEKQGSGK